MTPVLWPTVQSRQKGFNSPHRNRDRDAINSSVFEEFCRKSAPKDGSALDIAVFVFMDNLEMTNSANSRALVQSNAVKKHFYEICSEDDLKMINRIEGRLDSVLKWCSSCLLMSTRNTDVGNGEANGSRTHSLWILGVCASQVNSVVVKHVVDDIAPSVFEVKFASGNLLLIRKFIMSRRRWKWWDNNLHFEQFVCHRAQTAGKHMQGVTYEHISPQPELVMCGIVKCENNVGVALKGKAVCRFVVACDASTQQLEI
jgi:hypothetical protein